MRPSERYLLVAVSVPLNSLYLVKRIIYEMEHKESFGVSVSTPRSNAKGPAVETPHGGNSVPRDTAPAKETSRTGEEPPREEEKDEEKPADGEKSHPMDFSSPGSKSLPSIGSPISVETATKQTIHVIRRKPVGGAAAALRPRPLQVVREGGPAEKRINADDDEHNFKYCVVEPPVHVLVEEKIVAQTPEEKVLVGNVLVPHQQDPDKILVVQNLPHQQDADKIPVFGGDDAPIARPATAEGRVQQQKSRHDDMFGSAARELGLGVAHITGSVLKVTAAGPTLMSRSLERSQSNISNSGSRRKKDDGEGDQDKGSVKSEPVEYYEPTITGWRSGMTAARTVCYFFLPTFFYN